jgi:hypothetical protein
MVTASGVLAGTNLPARVDNNTNAPAAARKPMLLVQPVAGDLVVVARMAPAGAVASDGAVAALGGAVAGTNGLVVAGLGRAVARTNGLVVAGLSPAGRVMVDFVREIHGQQGIENDVAFLADVDVWRSGPLGEIGTQAMQARRRGDEDAYQALLARYWVEYGAAIERRRVLGKTGTQRPVPGR